MTCVGSMLPFNSIDDDFDFCSAAFTSSPIVIMLILVPFIININSSYMLNRSCVTVTYIQTNIFKIKSVKLFYLDDEFKHMLLRKTITKRLLACSLKRSKFK